MVSVAASATPGVGGGSGRGVTTLNTKRGTQTRSVRTKQKRIRGEPRRVRSELRRLSSELRRFSSKLRRVRRELRGGGGLAANKYSSYPQAGVVICILLTILWLRLGDGKCPKN